MKKARIGFAMCGSFCTHEAALGALNQLCDEFETVIPFLSERSASTDTRFGTAKELLASVEEMTEQSAICSISAAEPIGPKKLLDVLVIAPCTGNTLGKLANGITDSSVTMAAKAHLRNDRPVVLAIATNDGLGASAQNIGILLARKNFFFVPFGQDDAHGKPCSLIADFSKIGETVDAALLGRQIQPVLLK